MKGYIIFRDRTSYARRCVASLMAVGVEPVIVDHHSTYPSAVKWLKHLEKQGITVLYRGGGHPRGLWGWGPFWDDCGIADRYIVTDPDTVPSDGCPADWLELLETLLDGSDVAKTGLGLRLDNIPLHYPRRDHVLAWEAQFWQNQVMHGVYSAPIDTTLALHRPLSQMGVHNMSALRTGGPYTADHLPWYENPDDLPDEIRYYHEHAEPGISYWTIGGRSAWGD